MRDYAIIFLVFSALLLPGTIAFGRPPRDAFGKVILADYLAHYIGGRLLLQGQSDHLYSWQAQYDAQTAIVGADDALSLYVSPPFMAAFYAPLAALPYLLSAALWAGITLIVLGGAIALLRPLVPSLSPETWRLILLVAAAAQPCVELLGSGQDTALTLILWIAGIRLALARRDALAGAVFALGLFKPQLFLLPPLLFLVLRRPRALAGWLVVAGALASLSWWLVGWAGVADWIALVRSPLYDVGVQAEQAWKMQSWPSLLRAIMPGGFGPAAERLGLVPGILMGLEVLRLAARRGAAAAGERELWALACLTVPLVTPHFVAYDLLLVIVPIAILLTRRCDRPIRLALAALFLLTWTSPLRHVLAGPLALPLSALGASWSALPLLALWIALRRLVAVPSAVPAPAVEPIPALLTR